MRIFKLIKSIGLSAAKGIVNDPELGKIILRYPRVSSFIKRRFSANEVFGLYLSVGFISSSIFIWIFFWILKDFIDQDLLTKSDLRILNIIRFFRTEKASYFFFFVTNLGKWPVIFLGLILSNIIFAYLRRRRYVIALTMSVVFGELFVFFIKNVVERYRPAFYYTVIREDGYSFPSGHAFMAVAFYGVLSYLFINFFKRKWLKILTVFIGFLVILGISFSRIYLGVHWASDVLASLAAGLAWLSVIITSLKIRKKYKERKKLEDQTLIFNKGSYDSSKIKMISVSFFLFWIAFSLYYYHSNSNKIIFPVSYHDNLEEIPIGKENMTEEIFNNLPRVSETIVGESMEPINIIFVGSEEELYDDFSEAGWVSCDPLTLHSSWRMVIATLANSSYDKAPGVPSLWNAIPNDLAFEKPTEINSVKERHHVHFWKTPFILKGSDQKIWLGTAHFDMTIKLKSSAFFPTHAIDPAIDKEREKIKTDLLEAHRIEEVREFQIVGPTLGKNQAGDMFFTDGKSYIFFSKKD